MRMAAPGRLVLLAAVIAAGARPAESAPRLSLPSVSMAAGTGAEVSLRGASLPDDADELELVLSLDGGRTFPVRLTPALSRRDRVRFVVPAVPATRAVIAVRAGRTGDDEIEVARSSPFQIHIGPLDALESLVSHDGELWTRSARRGLPIPAPDLGAEAPAFRPLDDDLDAADLPVDARPSPDVFGSAAALPVASADGGVRLADVSPRLSLPKRE
jgi:hypothetical protein